MALRAVDIGIDGMGARDFVARERTPSVPQLLLVFASAFLIGVSIVATAGSKMGLILTLFALFSIVGWYVILKILRTRDMLLVTEFQNAMFASAMGLHNRFCLIIRRDGFIVYLDRSFQELFPDIVRDPVRSVEMLLKQGKVSAQDTQRVMAAIDVGAYEKVTLHVTDGAGVLHHVMLSVEPILRPAGFIMLRGREFVEERNTNATAKTQSVPLDRPSMALFSHVMESMKMGVYAASPTGVITYCNPVLEAWLGYREGEISAANLKIENLLPPSRNDNLTAEPRDIEKRMMMQPKVGGFIPVFLNQRLIKNEAGNVIGITAVAHRFPEEEKQKPIVQLTSPHDNQF